MCDKKKCLRRYKCDHKSLTRYKCDHKRLTNYKCDHKRLTHYKCDHKSLIAVVYKEGVGGRAYQIKSAAFVIDGGNYQWNRIS